MSRLASWALDLVLKLPPFLKGQVSSGIGKALLRKSKASVKVTNLGLSGRMRFSFEGEVPPHYLFGTPKMDFPEFGALEVCRVLSGGACDAFLDFGAHRGYFSFYVKKARPELSVYYFEPIPFLFDEIEKNVATNRFSQVTGVRAAVGARVGKTKFHILKNSLVCSSLSTKGMSEGAYETIDTDLLTFDEIARRYQFKNACVKVDVENAEFDFIDGATQEGSRIAFFIIEVLEDGKKRKFPMHVMKQLGMRAYYIEGMTLKHCPDGETDYSPWQLNWLFCRQTPSELRELIKGSPLTVRES